MASGTRQAGHSLYPGAGPIVGGVPARPLNIDPGVIRFPTVNAQVGKIAFTAVSFGTETRVKMGVA